MKCNNPVGPATERLVSPESAKVINKPVEETIIFWQACILSGLNSPGRPLARCVPTEVKNTPLVFFQFLLLWRNARVVFSPTLKIYLAESKVITTVGSVSEEMVLRTEAFQDMGADDSGRDCAEE